MASKVKFDDLETEIKALIIDKIIRPSDLKNVCLVNKQLHSLAVKPLYRNVALDLGSSADTKLSAFLSPKNIGLQHIRQMRLYLAFVRDRCNQEQQAHLVSRMILEFLPENILEEFRCGFTETWCPWRPFSVDSLLLLYRKQRSLRWLEVMDLDRELLPHLKKNEKMQKDVFGSARKLALYPENPETLAQSQFFVQRTAEKLEELIIHANFGDSSDPRDPSPHGDIEPRELNDSATAPGRLTSTIFSHMMPFEKCEPFSNLTSLRLHRISLRYCADTWCKIVDFTKMQYLRIYQCPGSDSLFGALCKSANLPTKLKVLEFQHKDNAENEALLALDGFLCLVSGLRDLVIDLENVKTLPAAAGIARHGKTLELLNVHGSHECSSSAITSGPDDCEELVWDTEDFEKICKACTGLEQLSCAWPQTSLIRAPGEEWKAYERACANLSDMVTLHISTWPTNKPSTQLLPRAIYENLLQSLAQRGFEMAATTSSSTSASEDDTTAQNNDDNSSSSQSEDTTSRPSKLRLIAFGISDKIYEREDSKNQIIYLRSTCQDAEGKTKVYAAPIGWCLRQYVEPRSEVLDFVLHREARPPCRDGRDGGGLGWNADDDDFGDV